LSHGELKREKEKGDERKNLIIPPPKREKIRLRPNKETGIAKKKKTGGGTRGKNRLLQEKASPPRRKGGGCHPGEKKGIEVEKTSSRVAVRKKSPRCGSFVKKKKKKKTPPPKKKEPNQKKQRKTPAPKPARTSYSKERDIAE